MRTPRNDKGTRRTQWVQLTCEQCPTQFERRLSALKTRNFCSRECFQQSTAASEGGIKGGGRPRTLDFHEGIRNEAPHEIDQASTKYGPPTGWTLLNGYVMYQWPTHPDSNGNRITEQRAVAYEYLGVELNGHRIVHRNGNPIDNTWDNLNIQTPDGSIPKPEGVKFWQGFYQWAKTHSPETIERYTAAS